MLRDIARFRNLLQKTASSKFYVNIFNTNMNYMHTFKWPYNQSLSKTYRTQVPTLSNGKFEQFITNQF